MAKNNRRTNRLDREFEDDYDYRVDYTQELLERRRNKQMRNALRTKNIDHLLDPDDEY